MLGAFCQLIAVAGHQHQRSFLDLKIRAVEHGALVVDPHGVGYLAQHTLEHTLGDDKAMVAGELGDDGEVGAGEGVHLMLRLTALDGGDHLIIDGEGNFVAVHDLDGLIEFLSVYYIGALFDDLCLDGDAHTFFQVIGSEDAGIGDFGFDENAFDGSQRRFSGHRAHEWCHGGAYLLFIEDDFHVGSPFL